MITILFHALTLMGATGEMSGLWLLRNKNKLGFILMVVGSVCWFSSAFLCAPVNLGLILLCPILSLINVFAWLKWNKDEKQNKING